MLVGWADDTDPTTGGNADGTAPGDGLTAGPGSPRWATKVIVNIDLAALRRGFTIAGERCEITGIGPVRPPNEPRSKPTTRRVASTAAPTHPG
ncbi:MAG: hypothetical protein U0Q07_10800 [Acidimicrobiales bacterium]